MRIVVGALYGGGELSRHIVVDRIENVGAVECDARNAAITFIQNF